ncbi:MAG: hypothetical protein QOG19_447, partial [Mycobacterium sp.]|nr:hypothetical protein [Mycobacterium sp.]
ANLAASPAPMPDAPPVTNATFPQHVRCDWGNDNRSFASDQDAVREGIDDEYAVTMG